MNEIDMPQAVALQCNHSRCPGCTPAGYQLDKTMEAAAKANTELRKTLRDHCAMAALQAVTINLGALTPNESLLRRVATDCYAMADAMMKARAKADGDNT